MSQNNIEGNVVEVLLRCHSPGEWLNVLDEDFVIFMVQHNIVNSVQTFCIIRRIFYIV